MENILDIKLTEKNITDILIKSGFEQIEKDKFYSFEYELEVIVTLNKYNLISLIKWIYEFYQKKSYENGIGAGKIRLSTDIKKLLNI